MDDIERMTGRSPDFRRVLYTGEQLQLVLMSLQPGEDTANGFPRSDGLMGCEVLVTR